MKIMIISRRQKVLTVAITAYLLSGFMGMASAAPITVSSTQMVTPSNNASSAIQKYNSIAVNQNSAVSSIVVEGTTVYLGISNSGVGNQPLDVYLTTPVSGDYTIVVSNDGSATTGKVMAVGIGSLNNLATTNVFGPVTAKVTATGGGTGKATAEAIGIGASEGALTVEPVTLAVTATGGTDLGYATGNAKGITAGGASTPVVVNVGNTTGTNSVKVTAEGGNASGSASNTGNVGAKAYGVENYENSTINLLGTTNISASATGGQPSTATSFAHIATGDAYGIYNSYGTVNADSLILTSVKGQGNVGEYTQGKAFGVYNTDGAIVNINTLTITELIATGGQASTGGYANADVYGLQNNTGKIEIAGAFTINALAQGGIGDNQATATAAGIVNGDTVNVGATAILGKTAGTNTVTITALGGNANGTDENNNVSAEAMGLFNNASTTLQGTTTFTVQATGGMPFEASNVAGLATAKAYGIYNQGAVLTTDDLIFDKVYATGKRGADTSTEAYGLYAADNSATLTLKNLTFTDIRAIGGSSSASGSANASAVAIWNENASVEAKNIIATVLAQAGTGDTSNAEAKGIYNNYSPFSAKNVKLTVLANGGISSNEAKAEAIGLKNDHATLMLTDGENKLNVQAYGGKGASLDESSDVSAAAYGLYNSNTTSISGITKL